MKQPLCNTYRWTVFILTAWVLMGLATTHCPAGITEGMTRAEVIERWGFPRAQLSQGNREYLDYGNDREVELRDGIVHRVEGAVTIPPPLVDEPEVTPDPVESESMEPAPVKVKPEPVTTEWNVETTDSIAGALVPILSLFFIVVMIAAWWKIYRKAGEPGWACLVPIYNMIVMIRIADKPGWWFLLLFVPVVQIVVNILIAVALAQQFGKSSAFGLGLVFLPFIFYPILGFGSARYNG